MKKDTKDMFRRVVPLLIAIGMISVGTGLIAGLGVALVVCGIIGLLIMILGLPGLS